MNHVKVNDQEVRTFLIKLNSRGLTKEALSAIRKGLNILAKQTTKNFKANRRKKFKMQRKAYVTKSGKLKTKILRVARVTTNKKENTVKVHIMDDYRVKWMEMGTDKRYTNVHTSYRIDGRGNKVRVRYTTSSSLYRGQVPEERFFRKAKIQTEAQVRKKIEEEMANAIKKVTNT